jgi:hypothetical protein
MKGTRKPMRMGLSLRWLIAKARMRKEEERSIITDNTIAVRHPMQSLQIVRNSLNY